MFVYRWNRCFTCPFLHITWFSNTPSLDAELVDRKPGTCWAWANQHRSGRWRKSNWLVASGKVKPAPSSSQFHKRNCRGSPGTFAYFRPFIGFFLKKKLKKIHWPRHLWRSAKTAERAALDPAPDLRSEWRLCPDGPSLWSALESSPSSGGLWHRTNLRITCRLTNDLTKSVRRFTAQNILQVALMVPDDVERPVGQQPLTNSSWFSHDYLRVGITAHVHVHLSFSLILGVISFYLRPSTFESNETLRRNVTEEVPKFKNS